MSTPISSRLVAIALLALAAACHRPPPGPDKDGNRVEQPIAAKDDDSRIACATDGGEMTDNSCTVETEADGTLVVRNPDGGFHRLRPTNDGSAVVAADGAERAQVMLVDGNTIEVAIGDDRYRLPAMAKGPPARP